MRFVSLLALVVLASASAPLGAHAHDLWLEPQGDHLVLRYGHRGGEQLSLDTGKVKGLLCARGRFPAVDVRASSKGSTKDLRTPELCDVAGAFLDGGYWSLTPDGEKNLPRNQVPDAVRSWQSRQFAKWIDVRSPGASTVLVAEMEIVPVSDLSTVRQGDKATFRVLWQGKPVAGAICAIDHRPLGETDADGQCRVKVRAPDVESMSVTLKRPLGAPEADTLVAEASLTFQVAR